MQGTFKRGISVGAWVISTFSVRQHVPLLSALLSVSLWRNNSNESETTLRNWTPNYSGKARKKGETTYL